MFILLCSRVYKGREPRVHFGKNSDDDSLEACKKGRARERNRRARRILKR